VIDVATSVAFLKCWYWLREEVWNAGCETMLLCEVLENVILILSCVGDVNVEVADGDHLEVV